MVMNGPFPWQTEQWDRLMVQHGAGRLPHALILTGLSGTGKGRFADCFAQALLCTQPATDGSACGECRGCRLFGAGSHPDIVVLAPEEQGKAIKVDQVRGVIEFMGLKTQYGGYRVVIVSPADAMNTAAANSLLKTLEEPPPQSLLILVTSRPASLPATIRSRCQQIVFAQPPRQVALDWLKVRLSADADAELLLALANGAPLAAERMAADDVVSRRHAMLDELEQVLTKRADPVAVAASWLKSGVKEPLYWLNSWIVDMIRLQSVPHPATLINPDLRDILQRMGKRLNLILLYAHLDRAAQAGRSADTQANPQLLLEGVLIPWAE